MLFPLLDGFTEIKVIVDSFASKYDSVNSNDSDLQLMSRSIDHDINNTCITDNCIYCHTVTVYDVKRTAMKLRLGKSGGNSQRELVV